MDKMKICQIQTDYDVESILNANKKILLTH